MDNLRFVLESPQVAQTQKKRPRLVTSCDNCRLKKIKCVPSGTHGKCEACEAGAVSCEFRDRERYFAERSRSVTAAAAASSGSTSSLSSLRRGSRSPANVSQRSSHGRRSPRSMSDASTGPAWYTSSTDHQQAAFASNASYPNAVPSSTAQSSDWFLGDGIASSNTGYFGQSVYTGPSYATSASPSGLSDTYSSYSSTSLSPSIGAPRLSMLFDPRRPQHPDPALMPHFLEIFNNFYGQTFPFLSYEDMANRVRGGTSFGLLECAIAALAARHSQSSTILACGTAAAVEAYANKAKAQMQDSSLLPYVYVLHAAILLAWVEYKAGSVTGLQEYCTTASKMAHSLGLGRDALFSGASASERKMYHDTWASILYLQQLTGSSTSRPPISTVDPSTFLEMPSSRSTRSHVLYDDHSQRPSDSFTRQAPTPLSSTTSGPTCGQLSLTSLFFNDLVASPMTALPTMHGAVYI